MPRVKADTAGITASLVTGNDGNSYGTTRTGGTSGNGTFYRVTPDGATTVLYNFTGGSDGGAPEETLVAGSDGILYGTTTKGGGNGSGTAFRATTAGALSTLFSLGGSATGTVTGFVRGSDGHDYGAGGGGGFDTFFKLLSHPAFFDGQSALDEGVYYLTLPNGNDFGYYTFLPNTNFIYHFDLGFEYVFDTADGSGGIYLYDFTSSTFFYTGSNFPFPYLYDFSLQAFLYYYPDTNNAGHYTSGPRYFYNFSTRQIITK